MLVFNQVAGETNEIGPEFVDRADDFRCILGVAFVMEIAELDEAAGRLQMQIELRDAQSGGLSKAAVDPGRGRQGDEPEPEKFSPGEKPHVR